ncbi:acetyl-CoA carboxylase carboxyltransferase subunit alpha [bacterium]|nr:acetyl-CoA carboxylase carboxyltransferase subunit alpha [bacterium]
MSEEKSFHELEKNIIQAKEEIEALRFSDDPEDQTKVSQLKEKITQEWKKIRPYLNPYHIVQMARHPQRPYTLDYISFLFHDFIELHGDRRSADDAAIVAGFAFYRKKSIALVGHQKGRRTRERLNRNFAQPNPEGYRKALRVMKLAEKFGVPLVTFIDTPGAYPGIRAEEKGQAEAIAYNIKEISRIKVPVVNVVIGEGGSGGALGIGVGDAILMLENSFYSVISPEGCAAILWKDQGAVSEAAENLKFLAKDLLDLGIIDEIIPEPPGGAHVDYEQTFANTEKVLNQTLQNLESLSPEKRLEKRYQKFRKIGVFTEK